MQYITSQLLFAEITVNALNFYKLLMNKGFEKDSISVFVSILIITRCVIVIDDHEASPSSSDCMTLKSDTKSLVSRQKKGTLTCLT